MYVTKVPRRFIGSDAFQETPIVEVSRQITKHNYLVKDVNDIPRIVKEAFYIASTGTGTLPVKQRCDFDVTGRPGPVLIDVPKDVQQSMAVPDWLSSMRISGMAMSFDQFYDFWQCVRIYEPFAAAATSRICQEDPQSHSAV